MRIFVFQLLMALASFLPTYAAEFALQPPPNFVLSPKYIAVHHPVKTNQVAAQLYFDQGLTFAYAFNHEAAYWSFLKATEIDPSMAMAYWGMALVLGPNINMGITPARSKLAYELVRKAEQLADNSPGNERAYIAALKQRYSDDPKADQKQLAQQYSQAMKEVVRQFPDDPDASTLYAESILDIHPWNQWSNDGTPFEGTKEAVEVLENTLVKYPEHLGANHYYVHAMEASPNPSRALLSADRLKTLLPSSGHILHMPSHIYILVGDFHQAVNSNLNAVAADREFIREYGNRGVYPVHYLSHNYHFLSQAYSMEGNYEGAKYAAKQLQALYLPHFESMPELEQYASTPIFVYLRFHKWKELLAMPEPPSNMHITRAMWHFGRSVALAHSGNMNAAKEEQRLFMEEREKVPASTRYGFNQAANVFQLAQYFLEGKLAEAQGQTTEAIEKFKKSVQAQDQLSYDEPPNWLFSVRESLGASLIKERKLQAAEEVFREDLRRHPRSGRALFGLRAALTAQSKWSDYYWVNQSYQDAWRYSDVDLNIDEL